MSDDPFLEVFFEAEAKCAEYPDFEEVALRNCNEHPETRHEFIEQLRSMILERGECHPRRMDDEYLLMFLRCRRFIVPLAHKMVVRYENFQHVYKDSLYACDILNLDRELDRQHVYSGTLPESPDSGRLLIMRAGRWEPSVSVTNAMRAGVAMTELVLQQPRIQVMGISIVVDLQGFSLMKLKYFSPTVAHTAVSLMRVNLPIPVHGIHFINYNWILRSIFYFCKPFIPPAGHKYIHFHGQDMSSLHRYIDPEHLPEEYGGCCKRVVTFEEWVSRIRKYVYRNEKLVNELRDIGYTVNIGEGENKIWLDNDLGWIEKGDRRVREKKR